MMFQYEKLTYGRVTHGLAMLTHYLSIKEIKIAMVDCTVLDSTGRGEGLPLIVTHLTTNTYLPPYNAKVGFIVLACDHKIPGTTQ
jgi:hypothetical protein